MSFLRLYESVKTGERVWARDMEDLMRITGLNRRRATFYWNTIDQRTM